MKLSCLPVSYFSSIIQNKMTIPQWVQEAKSLELDGIDLSVLLLKSTESEYLKGIKKKIESSDLDLAVVNTYPDFTHPDSDERKRQLSKTKKEIIAACQLGAKMVRITAGQAHPETSRDKGFVWAVEALKRLSEETSCCDIKLAFENHSKPGIWDYPDFCLPTEIFLEIAEKLKDTSIGILFDTANPLVYGDDPIPILEQVIGRVICVHVADTKEVKKLAPVIIGTGIVDFSAIFSKLKQFNYGGWFSVEEASDQGQAGVTEAVKFVRRTWKNASSR
ncbi:sugar phosphate isomerase/epimerase family protein [Planctomycetota bacterium]